MSRVGIFIADGFEEIEGLTVVDILRRAGIDIDMISINDENTATGSHKITVKTELNIYTADLDAYEAIVLPGGMPGTLNLGACEEVVRTIKTYAAEGKLVAAVCAAPSVLGENGLLDGRTATCYPGWEDKLLGARVTLNPVETDGNIITSRGMGTAIEFALAIVAYLTNEEAADKVRSSIVYRGW